MVPGTASSSTGALVTIVEEAGENEARIAIVSVIPGTGEVVWDEFEGEPSPPAELTPDTRIRNELETRLTHLQPAELLLPEDLSKESKKVIDHLSVGRSTADVRMEHVKQDDYATAFDYLTDFYKERQPLDLTEEDVAMDEADSEERNSDGQSLLPPRLTSQPQSWN